MGNLPTLKDKGKKGLKGQKLAASWLTVVKCGGSDNCGGSVQLLRSFAASKNQSDDPLRPIQEPPNPMIKWTRDKNQLILVSFISFCALIVCDPGSRLHYQ